MSSYRTHTFHPTLLAFIFGISCNLLFFNLFFSFALIFLWFFFSLCCSFAFPPRFEGLNPSLVEQTIDLSGYVPPSSGLLYEANQVNINKMSPLSSLPPIHLFPITAPTCQLYNMKDQSTQPKEYNEAQQINQL